MALFFGFFVRLWWVGIHVHENGPPRVGLLARRVSLTVWRGFVLRGTPHEQNDGDIIFFGFDGADISV